MLQSPVTSDRWKCLRCRYALKGLAGDPVRCPECGQLNRVRDLREMFEGGDQGELRGGQIGYIFSTGGMVLLIAGLAGLGLEPLGLTPLGVAFLALGLPLWIGGILSYRRACEEQHGIWPALFWFQAYVLLMIAGLIAVGAAWFFGVRLLAEHYRLHLAACAALVTVAIILLFVAALPLLRRLLRRFARVWNRILLNQGYD